MIDTIHIYLGASKVGVCDVRHHLEGVCNLTDLTSHKKGADEWITGHLGNMKVSANESSLSIKGSLPKWYFGSNSKELDFYTLKDVIHCLSDTLGLPVLTGSVNRLDVSGNLLTSNTPKSYFDTLDYLSRHERLPHSNGLYFANGSTKSLFYDKQVEVKKASEVLPLEYQGKNLLRYELGILNRKALQSRFKVNEFQPILFSNPNYFNQLPKAWQTNYQKVLKTREAFDTRLLSSVKDLEAVIRHNGTRATFGSLDNAMKLVEHAKANGIFTNKMQVKRLKDSLKRDFQRLDTTTENLLTQELDLLINLKVQEQLI
jgi:hypothetical protein